MLRDQSNIAGTNVLVNGVSVNFPLQVSVKNDGTAGPIAVKIKEEDKEKYPIPNKEGEYYEWRIDMTTEKRYPHNDFMEALDYIEVFKGEN